MTGERMYHTNRKMPPEAIERVPGGDNERANRAGPMAPNVEDVSQAPDRMSGGGNQRANSAGPNMADVPDISSSRGSTPIQIAAPSATPFFVWGALVFFLATLVTLAAAVWWLVKYPPQPLFIGTRQDTYPPGQIVDHYLSQFGAPLLLIIAAFSTAGLGLLLMRTVGASYRRVIPPEDYELINDLMQKDAPKEGREYYIRLSSLTGWTGMFTKMGITGLPLATILLTLLFAVLSLPMIAAGSTNTIFPDLAKLTLGAFLGSYVQRQPGADQAQPGLGGETNR